MTDPIIAAIGAFALAWVLRGVYARYTDPATAKARNAAKVLALLKSLETGTPDPSTAAAAAAGFAAKVASIKAEVGKL